VQSVKKLQIIESIKNMPDKEADILEVFVAGFRAGKMITMAENADKQFNPDKPEEMTLYQLSLNFEDASTDPRQHRSEE